MPHWNPHCSIRTHRFKHDIEDGEIHRVPGKVWGFYNGDNPDCEGKPPKIMCELRAELVFEEKGGGGRAGGVVEQQEEEEEDGWILDVGVDSCEIGLS